MMPEKIGRYELIRELGQGDVATVYLARDPGVNREVAIKVLPPQLLDDDDAEAQFEAEAKVIAGLEHSAIVPVYAFGEHDGQPYLVMRYMPGGTLADHLEQQGLFSLFDTARILRPIAAALDFAHRRGIIHRDLKPPNILFGQFGDAHLSDFGLTRMQEAWAKYSGSGVVGDPAHLSPEQARHDAAITSRSDIYALGVILFEMVSGRQPYQADTPAALAIKHIDAPIPRLSTLNPNLHPGLDDIIARALAKDPNERYKTASELAADVSQLAATPHKPKTSLAPTTPTLLEDVPLDSADSAPAPVAPTLLEDVPLESVSQATTPTHILAGEQIAPPTAVPAKKSKLPVGWILGCVGLVVVLVVLVIGGALLVGIMAAT